MAKCEIKLPEDLIEKISKLGSKTDEIVEKALTAGAEVTLPYVKRALHDVIGDDLKSHGGKSRSTGELERSLGASPMKIDKNGNANIKIGFKEPRGDGKSNAKIANIIENGKHGRPPKPFLKPAIRSARKACRDAVIKTFEEEISKL